MSSRRSASYPPSPWRLILHSETDGATNMAVDEAIVNAVVKGDSLPTLRFYAWSPPCLSLGRNQPLADVDAAACRTQGVDVVRRPTGGRAILHTNELTYSIALLQGDPRATGDVIESYRHLSAGLLAGLRSLDVAAVQVTGTRHQDGELSPVCFETPSEYEITVGGRKLVGSAQWRAREGVLQHGSLPLYGDLGRIVDFLELPAAEREAQRPCIHDRAITLEEAAGRPLSFEQAARALIEGFAQSLNLSLIHTELSEQERAMAAELRRSRYSSRAWTARV